MDSPTEIGNRVERLVQKHWSEHGTPLLLSALGNHEEGAISRQIKLEFGSLRSFLDEVLSNPIRVVEHSSQHAIVGVVPRNKETDSIEHWDPILEKTRSDAVRPRLHPALWAAFRKPLSQDKARYVFLDNGVRFSDVPLEQHQAGGIKVPRELILGIHASVEEMYAGVQEWIKANNLDIEQFSLSATAQDARKLPSKDLLGALIDALDAEDLRKFSMPMDVVAKLRRRPS